MCLFMAAGNKPSAACEKAGFSKSYYNSFKNDLRMQDEIKRHEENIYEKAYDKFVDDPSLELLDEAVKDAVKALALIINKAEGYSADKVAAAGKLFDYQLKARGAGPEVGQAIQINIEGSMVGDLERRAKILEANSSNAA